MTREARYYNDDAEISWPDSMKNEEFVATFGSVKSLRFDSFRRLVGKTIGTSEVLPINRVVYFKTSQPSLHKCGGKCRSATGHNCECSCGGKFHGIDA